MTEATHPEATGVVVGADGSDHGKAALEWAADTAVAYGLPLTVLFARQVWTWAPCRCPIRR